MPQTYSLDGVRVTKEVWEKARGVFVEPREVKVEVKKVEAKKEVAKPTKKAAKKKSSK